MNITHERTSGFRPLKITFTVESVNELLSLRALFEGAVAEDIIANSLFPGAPHRRRLARPLRKVPRSIAAGDAGAPQDPADTFITRVGSILDDACDEAGVEG